MLKRFFSSRPGPGRPLAEVLDSVAPDLAGSMAHAGLQDVLTSAGASVVTVDAKGRLDATFSMEGLDSWLVSRRQDVERLLVEIDSLRAENARLREGMLTDPATGLFNLSVFDADHHQLYARRRRSEEPYALLLADLDRLSDFNRRFGMAAGDEVVRGVAATIADRIRQTDRAYRYGGEEFAVILPGAQLPEAVAAAERIREGIEGLGLPHPTNPSGVVTVTVVAIAAGFRHPDTKAVIAEMEALLGDAKTAGRNVVVWPH